MKIRRDLILAACILPVMIFGDARAARGAERIEELIPEDAWGAVLIERVSRAVPPALLNPILEAMAPDEKPRRAVLDLVKSVPGPVLIGLLPPSKGSDDPTVFVVVEWGKDAAAFDTWMEGKLLPALREIGARNAARLKLEKDGAIRKVTGAPGSGPPFSYTIKDGRMVGATDPLIPLRWSKGQWPERRWVNLPGVKRLIGDLPRSSTLRAYVNPAALARLIPKPERNTIDELLLTILAPEDLEAVSVDASWEPAGIALRATLALASEPKGVARVLAHPGSAATELGAFPADFVALGRVGWGSLADWIDGAFSLCDRFDPAISAEFRAELEDFKKETGVDFYDDVLGNLVGEAAFGVRVDFGRRNPIGWASVSPLRDEAAFARAVEKLTGHFGLTFDNKQVAGTAVRVATQTRPFAMVVHAGRLIVASDAETAAEIAAQVGKGGGANPLGETLRACQAALPGPQSFCTLVDLGLLFKKAPLIGMAVGPKYAGLLARGSVGLALAGEGRVARLELRWSMGESSERRPQRKSGPDGEEVADAGESEDMQAVAIVAGLLTDSLVNARTQAKRTISMANMRAMGQALHIYSQERKGGGFPATLREAAAMLGEERAYLRMLTSPYDGEGPATADEIERKAYLIYRPGLSPSSDPGEIIMAERSTGDRGGANFLFVDGHVEFIPEPRANELIRLIEDGAESVRR